MYTKVQKKKYAVVRSPIGKMAKIDLRRMKALPNDWDILPKTNMQVYRADGGLQEKSIGLVELRHKHQFEQLSNPIYYDYGLMIGKIVGR